MAKDNLYLIVILPDDKTSEEIKVFQLDFANNFDSHKALSVITHVRLKAPFKLSAVKHVELLQWFSSLSFNTGTFQVELKNFGAFHNRYSPVIYVQPIMTVTLFTLQKELIRSFRIKFPEIGILDLEIKFNLISQSPTVI